jgi:hypothetical protein
MLIRQDERGVFEDVAIEDTKIRSENFPKNFFGDNTCWENTTASQETLINECPTRDNLLVADMLERKHDNVMRSIRTIMNSLRLGGEHYLIETLTLFQAKLKWWLEVLIASELKLVYPLPSN